MAVPQPDAGQGRAALSHGTIGSYACAEDFPVAAKPGDNVVLWHHGRWAMSSGLNPEERRLEGPCGQAAVDGCTDRRGPPIPVSVDRAIPTSRKVSGSIGIRNRTLVMVAA
jgi:hypothetical protein